MNMRFNRYMVECESKAIRPTQDHLKVLIDTWWNVNRFPHTHKVSCNLVLIDTWWNVNIVACGGLAWYIKF